MRSWVAHLKVAFAAINTVIQYINKLKGPEASSLPEHSSYCWQVKTAVIWVRQSRDASIPGQLGRPPPPSQDPRARVSIHQGPPEISHVLHRSPPREVTTGSARSRPIGRQRPCGERQDGTAIPARLPAPYPTARARSSSPREFGRPAPGAMDPSMSSWHSTVAHVMWR
jgi:hypothetical protein